MKEKQSEIIIVINLALKISFSNLQCILGSVVIVALKGMFLQTKDLPKLWRIDKIDFVSLLLSSKLLKCFFINKVRRGHKR